MLTGTSLDVYGVSIHPGDILNDSEDTFLVMDTDAKTDSVQLYSFTSDSYGWLDAGEYVHLRLTMLNEGAAFWKCIGHESRSVLRDGQYLTHLLQAHVVTMPDGPADHPSKSYCLSWDTTGTDELRFPTDANFVKYREVSGLYNALSNVHDVDALADLSEWAQADEELHELVIEFPDIVRDIGYERAKEDEWLRENSDRVYDQLVAEGIIEGQ